MRFHRRHCRSRSCSPVRCSHFTSLRIRNCHRCLHIRSCHSSLHILSRRSSLHIRSCHSHLHIRSLHSSHRSLSSFLHSRVRQRCSIIHRHRSHRHLHILSHTCIHRVVHNKRGQHRQDSFLIHRSDSFLLLLLTRYLPSYILFFRSYR